MAEILPIKRNQFHFCKFHIFCNPDHYVFHDYLSNHWKFDNSNAKKIKKDHHVHIFIAWITEDEIKEFSEFISFLGQKSQYKVTIHIPRSIDEHTATMIRKALDLLIIKGKDCFRTIADRDSSIFSFNMFNIDGDGILQITSDNVHSYTWRKITKKEKDTAFGGWAK